jgi:ribonuclease HI
LRHPTTSNQKEAYGFDPQTTNNQMELLAVIRGLESLKTPCLVTVFTDSVYVGQGMTQWMSAWKRNGWRRKGRDGSQPLKNVKMWQQLDQLIQLHEVKYQSVRGHSGHPENERCDELAVLASQQQQAST